MMHARRFNIHGQPLPGWAQPHASSDFQPRTPNPDPFEMQIVRDYEQAFGPLTHWQDAPIRETPRFAIEGKS